MTAWSTSSGRSPGSVSVTYSLLDHIGLKQLGIQKRQRMEAREQRVLELEGADALVPCAADTPGDVAEDGLGAFIDIQRHVETGCQIGARQGGAVAVESRLQGCHHDVPFQI